MAIFNNQRVNPIRSHKTPLNHHKIPYSYGFTTIKSHIPMVFLWFSYGFGGLWKLTPEKRDSPLRIQEQRTQRTEEKAEKSSS